MNALAPCLRVDGVVVLEAKVCPCGWWATRELRQSGALVLLWRKAWEEVVLLRASVLLARADMLTIV